MFFWCIGNSKGVALALSYDQRVCGSADLLPRRPAEGALARKNKCIKKSCAADIGTNPARNNGLIKICYLTR